LQDAKVPAHIGSKDKPQNEQPPTQMQDWRSHASIVVVSWEGRGMLNDDFGKPLWTFLTSAHTPV